MRRYPVARDMPRERSVKRLDLAHDELELLALLARGEREIEGGKGYDLDAVFAEADVVLEELRGGSPFRSCRKHLRPH